MNDQLVSPIPVQSPKLQMSEDEDKDAEPFEAKGPLVQKVGILQNSKCPGSSPQKCVSWCL